MAAPGIALSHFGDNVPRVNAPFVEGPTAPPIEDPVAPPFQQALSGLPFGVALHDASLRYVYVNDAMAAINGCTAAAHAGRAVEDILPAPVAAEVRALLTTTLETGVAAPRVRVRGQTMRDQSVRVFDCDYVPVWHAAASRIGPPTHVVALVRDVTSEAGLSDQLDLLRSILQQSTDALYVMRPDQQFRFVFVNQAAEQHYGRPAAELLTLRPIDLDPRWTMADLEAAWQHLTTIGPLAFETVHRTTGAGEIPVWVQSQAVWHGGVGYIAGSIRSLVDERAAERERLALREQLEHAQRLEAVGLLAGGVAHDFNNLLAVILANVELLGFTDTPADVRTSASAIRDATLRAADLTRQLLTFSRREAGPRESLSLNRVVDDAMRIMHATFPDRVEVRTTLSEALPQVQARSAELTQLVMNLVVNARDAMVDGGLLEVETAVETPAGAAPWVVLRVRDSGIGMDEATQARVFEPFFTTKAPGAGTGLGLSVVYGIVKALGGRVDVRSAPGRGTTISVWLPACEADDAAARLPATGVRQGRGELIMVVDDEAALLEVIARMLARAGYRCITASSGGEALARLAVGGDEIAVLLTDLRMPLMAGDELAALARRMRPALPVIFMSGQAEDATVRNTRLRGETVLAKPFQPAQLAALLATVLD